LVLVGVYAFSNFRQSRLAILLLNAAIKFISSQVDNQLLKYSAKEWFMKAALCRMCLGDFHGALVLIL
jgi:hypothetical protein